MHVLDPWNYSIRKERSHRLRVIGEFAGHTHTAVLCCTCMLICSYYSIHVQCTTYATCTWRSFSHFLIYTNVVVNIHVEHSIYISPVKKFLSYNAFTMLQYCNTIVHTCIHVGHVHVHVHACACNVVIDGLTSNSMHCMWWWFVLESTKETFWPLRE